MSTHPDLNRIVRSWLHEDAHEDADRVLDLVLDQLDATPQRRAGWLARRFSLMNNNIVRFGIAAAAVVIAAVLLIRFLPGGNVGGPSDTATPQPSTSAPTSTPAALPAGALPAGTYVIGPTITDSWLCPEPPTSDCSDSIRILFTVPVGWSGLSSDILLTDSGNSPPDGAGLLITRGGSLYSDPCRPPETPETLDPDLVVGLTVDDFANALADHPLLEVTTPVDVTLAGYSGKYVDLQVPLDISQCDIYRPWVPGIYAQGPGHQWHLWILDVEGQRIVVQTTDYEGTSPEHQAELQAIVDSIQIEP